MRLIRRSAVFAALVALAALALPLLASEPLKFTVVGIDCAACAPPILRALRAIPGVRNPTLDWKAGTATVEIGEGFDRNRIRAALKDAGFEAVFPGDPKTEPESLSETVLRTLDIATVSEDQKIDAAKVAVAGKITILDYWAEWCSPCRLLEVRLQHFAQANPGVAIRRVHVGTWNSPAAKQASSEFHVESLPYVRVYDARGKFVGAETGGTWEPIARLVDRARDGAGR